MIAKVFTTANCPTCKSDEFNKLIRSISTNNDVITYNVDTLDGLAELSFYGGVGVTSFPLIILENDEEKS